MEQEGLVVNNCEIYLYWFVVQFLRRMTRPLLWAFLLAEYVPGNSVFQVLPLFLFTFQVTLSQQRLFIKILSISSTTSPLLPTSQSPLAEKFFGTTFRPSFVTVHKWDGRDLGSTSLKMAAGSTLMAR